MKQEQIKSELRKLAKSEERFISKNIPEKEVKWKEKIDRYIPEKLGTTLNSAFCKAFTLIFEDGTGIIEKTYNKEKLGQDYKVNEYSAGLRNNKSSLKKFGKVAYGRKTANTAVSAAAGIGMGVLGMGIPDIPVFLAIILKSIYEIAINFGFGYETEEEQMFILKIIETSLCHGDSLMQGDMEINDWIQSDGGILFMTGREEQVEKTSLVLSEELLYFKFIQGIPVIGITGGISDMVYQKKITDYAFLKYKKRFLLKHTE